jgi:hypothetical protein
MIPRIVRETFVGCGCWRLLLWWLKGQGVEPSVKRQTVGPSVADAVPNSTLPMLLDVRRLLAWLMAGVAVW